MFCSKCGASNTEDAKTCTSCSFSFETKGVQSDKAREQVDKAKEQVDKAKEQVKVAVTDAWATFKALGLDPVGGLLNAFQGLGKGRSLGVGVAFGVVFALCLVISLYQIPYFKYLPNVDSFGGFVKLLLVGVVPFVALTTSCIVGEKVGAGGAGIAGNSFISGVALLPLGAVFLIAAVVGVGNFEVIGTFAIIGVCISILVLFAGLTRIGGVTEKIASVLVPIMLIVSVWFTKIILVAIFS